MSPVSGAWPRPPPPCVWRGPPTCHLEGSGCLKSSSSAAPIRRLKERRYPVPRGASALWERVPVRLECGPVGPVGARLVYTHLRGRTVPPSLSPSHRPYHIPLCCPGRWASVGWQAPPPHWRRGCGQMGGADCGQRWPRASGGQRAGHSPSSPVQAQRHRSRSVIGPQRLRLGHGLGSPVPHPLAWCPAPAPRPCLCPDLLPPRVHTHATPPAPPSLVSPVSLAPLGVVLSIMPIPGASGTAKCPQCPQAHWGPPAGPWAAVPRGAGVHGLGPCSLPAAGISGPVPRPPPPDDPAAAARTALPSLHSPSSRLRSGLRMPLSGRSRPVTCY